MILSSRRFLFGPGRIESFTGGVTVSMLALSVNGGGLFVCCEVSDDTDKRKQLIFKYVVKNRNCKG